MSQNEEIITGSLISFFSNKVKKHGGINLAQGIPGFEPPKELLDILSKTIYTNCHQYAPGLGNIKLREEILRLYSNISSNTELFVTNGATEAISLIYTYLNKILDGKINSLSFSPAYESYIHLPQIFENNSYSIPTGENDYLDIDLINKIIQEKDINVIFLASPGNPYGRIIPEKEFKVLCDICNRENIYLIIDAVYKDLYLKEKPYYPTENISEYIFYINSFSKKFSITGWRIGYFLCNKIHIERLSYIHDYIGLSSPAPLQEALAKYLAAGNYNRYIDNLKEIIIDNIASTSRNLEKVGFSCKSVDGGYFVWAKLPKGFKDGLDFGLKLYELKKTAIIPGQHFGDDFNKYIRINVARPKKELQEGINRIIEMVKS